LRYLRGKERHKIRQNRVQKEKGHMKERKKERKKYGNKQTEMQDSFCFVGSEVLTVLTMKTTAFWVVLHIVWRGSHISEEHAASNFRDD
jgi:hypothetical protein